MDQDQDLLDQLDIREGASATTVALLTLGFAILAGAIAYFTLRLELHSSGEVSTDGGALAAIAAAAALWIGYRRLR